jgi:F0F1-type ATP synthase membrane subunit c/vacuolar-type H+-ATPase subunit K
MGTGASVPTGTPLQLTLSGLPHRSRGPVYVTLAIAGGLALWGAWMAMSNSTSSAAALVARRRELEGHRDRGLAALAALERRQAARALAEDDYIEERRSLVSDLERVYSELDDRGGLPGGGQGLAA